MVYVFLVLFLLSRILVGGYFLQNAWNHFKNVNSLTGYAHSKGIKHGKVAVIGSGILLLIGGAGILLGIAIPIAVLALILFLVPTTFIMHRYWKITDPTMRMMERVNFMKNLALLGGVIAFVFIATPWPFALL
jgi:putative oxidoreductase